MMRKSWIFTSVVVALVALALGVGPGWAQPPEVTNKLAAKRLENAARKEAAARAKKLGLKPGAAALAAQAPDPGGIPHYFGPYGNWAFSPLPAGSIGAVTLVDPGNGYNNPIVTIDDAYLPGVSWTFPVTATAGVVDPVTPLPAGSPSFMAPVVTITENTDLCGGAGQPACGTGAAATATLDLATLTGGMSKFVDRLPGLGPGGANNIDQDPGTDGIQGQYIPVAVADTTAYPQVSTPGQPGYKPASDYYEIALVEYSEKMHSALPPTRLRGYVQLETRGALAAIDASRADADPNNDLPLSKSVSVGNGLLAIDNPHYLGPLIVAQGRAHGVASPAGDPKPVRIKFYNLLPAGAGGNLFIPVDETVMGAGYGPALPGAAGDKYTQNRAAVHLHGNNTVWISDGNVHQWITPANETTPYPAGVSARNVPDMPGCASDPANPLLPGSSGCMTFFYTNAQSARLMFYHDHALAITRLNVYAGEAGGWVLTDAVEQDMINGTNVSGVNIPKDAATACPKGTDTIGTCAKVLPDIGIPLVIQDKTFVDNNTIFAQDPTWNWGTGLRNAPVPPETVGRITEAVTGDLWYPHIYMTVQNPWDLTGTNAFGRWHYGPWFNPPTPTCVNGLPLGCIEVGPVPNEYYDPIDAPWEPPKRPGLPNPSIPGESFLDTAMVNGTAYPYLEVEPKAYRFRILNAANDRMFNLQLYVAADKSADTTATAAVPAPLCTGGIAVDNCTEVRMVPVSVAPKNQFADTPSGIPDPTTAGPPWIQIGTEGGFKPAPVVVPHQPIGYNLDPAYFSFGLVNQHSLFLGSAERADVVVDFGEENPDGTLKWQGKTLILYNDSPAPVPAGAAPYDFYTGNGNLMDAGGAPNTQPGYGPNTRTIMQIRVTKPLTTPTDNVSLANLEAVFKKGVNPDGTSNASKRGVFEVSQDPIIMPQAAFGTAYNNPSFPKTSTGQYVQIGDLEKTFQPINEAGALQPAVTLPLEMKAMHDEMGGVYDTLFGRMSGMLGLSNPLSPVHVLIPYGLASPPTDLVKGSIEGTPIGVLPNGTQIWRIFHNGVDTHPIHVHLFTAQLINRVDQSGQVTGGTLPVDPIDLGWKETFKVNPLEVTYLALRPTIPTPEQLPFDVPNSIRLIDPTLPEDATLIPPPPAGWFDPEGIQIDGILNHYVNFGWEYVWHCHILSHEEMDMMHTLVYAVPPKAPTLPTPPTPAFTVTGPAANPVVNLFWVDNSENDTHFTIQRATNSTFTEGLTTFTYVNTDPAVPSSVTFPDPVTRDAAYWYRVYASNLVGDTADYSPSIGFPTKIANSEPILFNNVVVGTPPAAPAPPTGLTATLLAPTATIPGPRVSLTWRDNATNETGFVVERCTVVPPATGCSNFAPIAQPGPRNNVGNVTYVDTTVTAGNTYDYRVKAINLGGSSAYADLTPDPPGAVSIPTPPAAPSRPRVTVGAINGQNVSLTLAWTPGTGGDTATGFFIQRATNDTFTTGLSNFTDTASPFTQNVKRKTTHYYRIRAYNNGGTSDWVKALPFPIRP